MVKKAQTVKIARPKVREVRKLYRGLLTMSIVNRVETLKTVLQWYDQALEYVRDNYSRKKTWGSELVKIEDVFLGHRFAGIRASSQDLKEKEFVLAIEAAERLCKVLHPFRVQRAYVEYERLAARMVPKQTRLELRYGKLMSLLENALQPGMAIKVAETDKARAFSNPAHLFLYNRKGARDCQVTLRKHGLLALVVQELRTLSRAVATEDDGNGHFKVNHEWQVESLFRMLDNFVKYCQGPDAPKRLVKGGT